MRRFEMMTVGLLGLLVVLSSAASVAAQAESGQRRGMRTGRDSLWGLLRIEEVRQELKLAEEPTAKVAELGEKVDTEMRETMASLRDIADRDERRTKMAEARAEFDAKARAQLREVLSQDQMRRLFQIRMQNRSTIDNLTNRWIAGRLELTDDQKQKLAEIGKDAETKQFALRASMRDAPGDGRAEAMQTMRDLRTATDKQAMGVLTEDQKTRLEEMKGEKLELPRRGRRQAT